MIQGSGERKITQEYICPPGTAISMWGGTYTSGAAVTIAVEIGKIVTDPVEGDALVCYPNPVVWLVIEDEVFAVIPTTETRKVEYRKYDEGGVALFLPAEGVRLSNPDHALLFTEGQGGRA